MVTIGGTHFSQAGIDSLSEEQFKAIYRGKLNIDLGEAWKIICANKTKLCEQVNESFQENLGKKTRKKKQ